jgi:predicted metal-binding membrane protein
MSSDASAPARSPRTLLESAIRHERVALTVVLLALPLVAWSWIVAMARDMYGSMAGASAWMMTTQWDARHLLLLWVMWAVMMAAMMLPSATPLVLLYGQAARNRGDAAAAAARIYALASGYVLVWGAFSIGATVLQWLLARALILTPMMEPASRRAAAVVLLIAGIYQLTPLKRVCLSACRSPIAFLSSRWQPGARGALRMGMAHGVYCLGCCWALMLLLFAGGVMNLAVIVALTAWVMVEKLAPFGRRSASFAGAALSAVAVWMWFS